MTELIKIINDDFKKRGLKINLPEVTEIIIIRVEQYINEMKKEILREVLSIKKVD